MSRGLDFGDAVAAFRLANKNNALYGPQGAPHYITGSYYFPQGYCARGNVITTTINRCYYFPFAVWEAHTFQGATTINSGAGDNTEKIRIMVFKDDGAIGGPGTLVKDFGEITLTASADVLRTLSSSWAAVPGLYWGAVWHQTAAAMYSMEPISEGTTVGAVGGVQPSHMIGNMSLVANVGNSTHCHYVDTTYGVAPSTAVAPTASLKSAGGYVGLIPIFTLLG